MRFNALVQSILEGNAPAGMDTYWQDGNTKVTIKDVIEYLDSIKAPVKEVSIEKIKPIIIDQDYEGAAKERVQRSDLQHPLIIIVSKGKYKSILDGNHRAFKALANNIDTVKVREVDLDSKDTPQAYKALFDYSIEPLKEGVTKEPKSLDIIDSYRGVLTTIATLIGDDKSSETINGTSGDGSDEFKFSGVPFDAAVDYGVEIGLWEEDGEGNLVVIDSDKWEEFYSETVDGGFESWDIDDDVKDKWRPAMRRL